MANVAFVTFTSICRSQGLHSSPFGLATVTIADAATSGKMGGCRESTCRRARGDSPKAALPSHFSPIAFWVKLAAFLVILRIGWNFSGESYINLGESCSILAESYVTGETYDKIG
jgi:hypothetical protein